MPLNGPGRFLYAACRFSIRATNLNPSLANAVMACGVRIALDVRRALIACCTNAAHAFISRSFTCSIASSNRVRTYWRSTRVNQLHLIAYALQVEHALRKIIFSTVLPHAFIVHNTPAQPSHHSTHTHRHLAHTPTPSPLPPLAYHMDTTLTYHS